MKFFRNRIVIRGRSLRYFVGAASVAAIVLSSTHSSAQVDCNIVFASLSDSQDGGRSRPERAQSGGGFSRFLSKSADFLRDNAPVVTTTITTLVGERVCADGGSGGALCRVALANTGVLLGTEISRQLTENSQRRLLAEAHQTILDGRPRTLALPEGNICARTTAAEATEQMELPVTLAFAPQVDSPGRLSAVGQNHETSVRAAVRSQPTNAGGTLTTLPAGSPLLLMGHVPGSQGWSLVGQGGVAVGYVQTQQLRPSTAQSPEWGGSGETRLASVPTSMTCRSSTNAVASSDGRSLGSVTARGCAGPEGLAIAV